MKIVHPFDLIKISADWRPSITKLSSNSVPAFVGQPHPTKPFVAVEYESPLGPESPHHKKLVWSANKKKSAADDAALDALIENPPEFDHPEDLNLFKDFLSSVRNDPSRHVRKSFDEENHPRARHILNHFSPKTEKSRPITTGLETSFTPQDSQIAFANAKKGRTMVFQVRRHKTLDRGSVEEQRVDHFVFHKNKPRASAATPTYVKKEEKTPTIQDLMGHLKWNEPPKKS